jgi:hypothetical protein
MELQKFSQSDNKIVYLLSFIEQVMNNAASIYIKKERFFTIFVAFYGPDTEPELEP